MGAWRYRSKLTFRSNLAAIHEILESEMNLSMPKSSIRSSYVARAADGVFRVGDSRVSLDSVVYGFLRGETPESLAQNFPTLELEQVYGAIAFYLSNREEIDAYLEKGERDFDRLREEFQRRNPRLRQKLEAARLQHA